MLLQLHRQRLEKYGKANTHAHSQTHTHVTHTRLIFVIINNADIDKRRLCLRFSCLPACQLASYLLLQANWHNFSLRPLPQSHLMLQTHTTPCGKRVSPTVAATTADTSCRCGSTFNAQRSTCNVQCATFNVQCSQHTHFLQIFYDI